MRRIVITEFMDDAAVAALAAAHDVTYAPWLVDDRTALENAVAAADALVVRNRTRVDRALLAAGARLRVVGRLGVGLDNIDVDACRASGIEVIPATGANALAVAEYVIAMAMLLLRGIHDATSAVANGEWPRQRLSSGRELSGKTLGIVGFGSIGQRLATLARMLDVRVLGHDPAIPGGNPRWREAGVQACAFETLLAEADVVSLHVPLTADTRHLVDARRLALMRPGAILVNTARGGVVDEHALAAALRASRLAGAALDVFEEEPLPAGSVLADCPNLVLTPHVAGVTAESNQRVSAMIAERVAAALARYEG